MPYKGSRWGVLGVDLVLGGLWGLLVRALGFCLWLWGWLLLFWGCFTSGAAGFWSHLRRVVYHWHYPQQYNFCFQKKNAIQNSENTDPMAFFKLTFITCTNILSIVLLFKLTVKVLKLNYEIKQETYWIGNIFKDALLLLWVILWILLEKQTIFSAIEYFHGLDYILLDL